MSDGAGRPPSRLAFAAEGRVAAEWIAGRIASRRLASGHEGAGRTVLVLPGFLADDHLTGLLRRTLARAGYAAHGWGLGRNMGITPALLARMLARLDDLGGQAKDRRLALVGWSLGGLYARELAKLRPALIERVVTLGSPFSGDLHWTNAWRLYERINGYRVDAPPVAVTHHEKPPVPTIAIWSPRDGIVAPVTARGLPRESDRRVRVVTSHMGLICAPLALSATLDALAMPAADILRDGA